MSHPSWHIETSTPRRVPLSFQQEGFWKWSDHRWNYPISTELLIRGSLRVDILRQSFLITIRRHEALRTRIVVVDGVPMQEIDDSVEMALDLADLSSLEASDARLAAERYLDRTYTQPINLERGPLLVAHLLRLGEQEHVLAVALHHIVADSISFSILMQEVWTLYSTLAQNLADSRPNPRLQYADYASWQRSLPGDFVIARQEQCRKRIAGSSGLHFPVDKEHECLERFSLGQLQFSLDQPLSAKILALARDARTTPAIVTIAVFSTVCGCWCDQDDFLLPMDVAGRLNTSYADTIGLFSHGLVLRVRLDHARTFGELLQALSSEFLIGHEASTFGTSLNPIVPLLANSSGVQWFSWHPIELGGYLPSFTPKAEGELAFQPFRARTALCEDGLPKDFLLTSESMWRFVNTPRGIAVRVYYRRDLFTSSTMERLARAFEETVWQVVRAPDVVLSLLRSRIKLGTAAHAFSA